MQELSNLTEKLHPVIGQMKGRLAVVVEAEGFTGYSTMEVISKKFEHLKQTAGSDDLYTNKVVTSLNRTAEEAQQLNAVWKSEYPKIPSAPDLKPTAPVFTGTKAEWDGIEEELATIPVPYEPFEPPSSPVAFPASEEEQKLARAAQEVDNKVRSEPEVKQSKDSRWKSQFQTEIEALKQLPPDQQQKFFDSLLKKKNKNPMQLQLIARCYEKGIGTKLSTKDAFNWYRKAADAGGDEALVALGNAYLEGGLGQKVDQKKGFNLLKSAADKHHHPFAQALVAKVYLNGFLAQKPDLDQGRHYAELSAKQNFLRGNYLLGVCHLFGYGGEKNEQEAKRLFEMVLSQTPNDVEAQAKHGLGLYFENTKNLQKAKEWYAKAAEHGSEFSVDALARIEKKEQLLLWKSGELAKECERLRNLNDQEQREIVPKLLKEANQNNKNAQYLLAYCHERGIGVPLDDTEAAKWLERAAEEGVVEAQIRLGQYYLEGIGVDKDKSKGVSILKKVADKGNAEAQALLGASLLQTRLPQDQKEGLDLIDSAIRQNHPLGRLFHALFILYKNKALQVEINYAISLIKEAAYGQESPRAQLYLGRMTQTGKRVKQNDQEAVKLFRLAADQGESEAQFELAKCYENGRGIDKDIEAAKMWYAKAAQQGNEEAAEALNLLSLA